MPMRSFGLYCAVLILVNYAFLILFLPPLVIWQEDHLLAGLHFDLLNAAGKRITNTFALLFTETGVRIGASGSLGQLLLEAPLSGHGSVHGSA